MHAGPLGFKVPLRAVCSSASASVVVVGGTTEQQQLAAAAGHATGPHDCQALQLPNHRRLCSSPTLLFTREPS
jgi:hypothetical protein